MPAQHSLYGGSVILSFDEAQHSYTVAIDGADPVPCVNVTGVLKVIDKPALPRWAAKEAAAYVEANLKPGTALDEIQIANLVREAKAAPWRKADDAASIGGIVHRFAELWALGERPPPPINPQAKNAADQFVAWWESNHVEVIAAERKVYSRRMNVAGTVDLIAGINGELCNADHKTASALFPEYRIQLAAYREARLEELGEEATARWCLRFGKDGSFEAACYRDHAADMAAFEAALSLYRWQESIKTPRKRRAA